LNKKRRRELVKKLNNTKEFPFMKEYYMNKIIAGMDKDYGIKIGKVSLKECKEIMKYKGREKRNFRLKSFKRKGNLRVIYLYV